MPKLVGNDEQKAKEDNLKWQRITASHNSSSLEAHEERWLQASQFDSTRRLVRLHVQAGCNQGSSNRALSWGKKVWKRERERES